MPAEQTTYSRTFSYNSFSGCDIKANLFGQEVGNLQGISYTITREKAPIYTMGRVNPRGFARGKRGIAGSLIFLTFDKDAFLDAAKESNGTLVWDEEILSEDDYFGSYTAVNDGGTTGRSVVRASYPDQMMPFDIVLRAVNEYGAGMQMSILGVEILNAGSGSSVDDITIDSNMTYVCREIHPWRQIGKTVNEDLLGAIARKNPTVYTRT